MPRQIGNLKVLVSRPNSANETEVCLQPKPDRRRRSRSGAVSIAQIAIKTLLG
jgi:hypothetical protein